MRKPCAHLLSRAFVQHAVLSSWAVVASRLVEQGVFVSISAGNSGTVGERARGYSTSAPHAVRRAVLPELWIVRTSEL